MRTANNNSNFTVEALIAKYRKFVMEHCPQTREFDGVEEFLMPMSPYGNSYEQLMVTLYQKVAGNQANEEVLTILSEYSEAFYSEALTEEEMSFLCSNFVNVVELSIERLKNGHSFITTFSTPELEIIRNNAPNEKETSVFIADAGFGDIALLFSNCKIKGYIGTVGSQDEVWAFAQIRFYAHGISSDIRKKKEDCTDNSYFDDIDCVIMGTHYLFELAVLPDIYSRIKLGTQIVVFLDSTDSTGKGDLTYEIRKMLVNEHSIKSIMSYECENAVLGLKEQKIALIIEKKSHDMVQINNGFAGESFEVPSSALDCEILWPGFYNAKRPEGGIPLSEIVTSVKLDEHILIEEDGTWVLPESAKTMPVVTPIEMAKIYKDANLLTRDLVLAENFDSDMNGMIVSIKERCILLFGNNEKIVTGYINELPETGIATLRPVVCLIPKADIDVRYVAALLLNSEIKDQILSICQGVISSRNFPQIIDKIIVPNHSDKERLSYLSEANYEALQMSQKEMKQEQQNYENAVRMRKHALTQSLSSIKSWFNTLNTYRIRQKGQLTDGDVISKIKGTTVKDAFEFLSTKIEDMMPTLEHIAAVEYSFSEAEYINPEKFIEDYIRKEEKGWLNFKSVITWEGGKSQAKLFFPKNALEKVFNNIISNAKAHAFTDKSRNDYAVRFSWHTDGMALIIEIENNGTPIPEDRDTAKLLEYGVSTALHKEGHNGIGCNEIDCVMKQYDGEVEIVSMPKEEYTVKYILTFNKSNLINQIEK